MAPVVSGNTLVGYTLSTTNGTWTDSLPLTFNYQWYRGATLISGATNNTYITQSPADVGFAITCRVTATNSLGYWSLVTSSNSVIPTLL